MQAHHYPFIDLAVHASVRDRFAKGDAVAVLSRDLGEVLWANGAAAHLFGFSNIYDVLDEGFGGQSSTRRQIESAVSGLNRTGRPQNFMMRVTSGFTRSMAPATLETITLPDGAEALLMTSSQAGQVLAPGARARQIIAGFEGTGTHVAVLDQSGQVLAASSTFNEIGLAETDIARMIADVAGAKDRLVKRMTQARSGAMPTAIGRLADDPVLHLLFAVEPAVTDDTSDSADDVLPDAAQADMAQTEMAPVGAAGPDLATDAVDETGTEPADKAEIADAGPAADIAAEAEAEPKAAAPNETAAEKPQRAYFDTGRIRDELNARLAKAEREAAEQKDVPAPFAEARGLEFEPASEQPNDETEAEEIQAAEPEEVPAEVADQDVPAETAGQDIPVSTDNKPAQERVDAPVAAGSGFRFDPHGKPARFVWKINRNGEFSEVSPEFAATVGPQSADIIGRKFPDLARVFNLDPDHVISDLLNRRDTWSGKTVLWPIQGTDLVTPVDLAALPTYNRDRHFDGFRGFGIVRTGEARKDPEALGLALVPGGVPASAVSTTIVAEPAVPSGTDVTSAEDETDLEMRNLEQDIEDLARMDGVEADAADEQASGDDAETGMTGSSEPDQAGADETTTEEDDPFRGERPAIRLVETPMRRDSDKIISLEARRPRLPKESLSPGEQAAFREIGARLNETSASDADAPARAPETGTESAPLSLPEAPQSFGKRQTPVNDDQPDTGDIDVPFEERGAEDREPSPAQTAQPAEASATLLPSAFALPARQVMQTGLDASIIDAIPAALLVHSGDELIHANAEFLDLTGYETLSELAACGGLDHLLERSVGDDAADSGGMFVRRGDGSRRAVTARLRSVNWDNGHALLLALSPSDHAATLVAVAAPMVPDIEADAADVETAQHESALEIEAQELRSILETATDGVVILNNDGTIRSMNGSACALFNYDESETLRQPFAMLFAHESQRAVIDYVSGLAEHGVSSVLNDGREVIGREASGGFLPLFMTIGRLSGSNGYCAVLRDITQWKRTEEELRNAKRAAETANSHKSDFLARVSHEIRTPLNAIIGFSEMMVEERFGPIGSPRYLEYAHDIGNSGKHVLDIVNDLLDISKIEAGQVSMEFVAVSLNDHLAESVSLLQPMANSQRVIIRTSLSASVPEVVADQRSIKQIALNLLSNAIRYTPSGGQIVVSTSYEPSGNVLIRIRDTGIGMDRKELEQAMKPFGQVGPGPRQRGDGTGLGLPLTKAMVEANRAQFDIVSTPGEGTLVSIAFPPQRVLAD